MTRIVRLASPLLLVLGGCIPMDFLQTEPDLAQVPTSPFAPAASTTVRRAKVNYAPAAEDVAWRVDATGRKLLDANPQAGLKPMFATIGSKEPEIFHADSTVIYVTEGLVRACKTEAELAAVMACELGEMVAEREASTSRALRDPARRPPVSLPIGGQGNGYAADPIHEVEMARFEKNNPRKKPGALAPPDARAVARTLLEQAGYQQTDLDAAAPILQAAEGNCALERQFKGLVTPSTGWQP